MGVKEGGAHPDEKQKKKIRFKFSILKEADRSLF